MPFKENIAFMKALYDQMKNKGKHSNIHSLDEEVRGLSLRYPGKLKGNKKGDYCLYLNDYTPTHADIVNAIHHYCQLHGGDAAKNMNDFIADIAENGLSGIVALDAPFSIGEREFEGHETRVLLYWLVLQEDINYPKEHQMGVRMPLTRYTEAIISATEPDLLNLQTVLDNTNERSKPPKSRFEHEKLPMHFERTFLAIESIPREEN